ncbi:hypothetical protein L5515_017174 [Caenorhabditis briggsae]|uniref:Uncharacterized protein n=1 Tax=Caenorhabditis briggsae TaxID=6238 RepID=A0AAE9FGC7_CAEBR|nr:hypothetical protein L5515_017174 [Caenorhabditis briggsae]
MNKKICNFIVCQYCWTIERCYVEHHSTVPWKNWKLGFYDDLTTSSKSQKKIRCENAVKPFGPKIDVISAP